LSEPKLNTIRDLGITRLSLGVENFSDAILQENGRAHLSAEIHRAWEWITAAQFPNVNIDLIAGMAGETWDNWKDCVRRTIELAPDSVTIYQMELPFNTVYSKDILGNQVETPVADWPTKRDWVNYAFDELTTAGFHVSSAYTMVKDPHKVNFSYRDNLWAGSDLVATGIASFGSLLDRNQLPLGRAMRPTPHQLLIREMILQLKRGYLDAGYFRDKFTVDILSEWREVWQRYQYDELLSVTEDRIELTRKGLLLVDALLPPVFESDHQGVRYT
jgi:oxygen-independent coproporphyrinogen-3 oxidase